MKPDLPVTEDSILAALMFQQRARVEFEQQTGWSVGEDGQIEKEGPDVVSVRPDTTTR